MTAETLQKDGERIAKVMARAGLCSRREAESWIAAGRVSVNGSRITSPALNVAAADIVAVDGKPLPKAERTRLFLYHKPRGLVTTNADPEKRPTIFDALPKNLPRLVSVGRLDLNTEGLLLLTNDGGLARVLEHPDTGWLRRYRVRAHGRVTQAQLDALRPGVTVDGIRYGRIEATLDRDQGANVWVTFAIREGKNREVRNVLEHLGLKVNRLIRVSFGPFQLGDLPEGVVEEVRTRHLREQLGERIAAQSGADFTGPMTPIAPVKGGLRVAPEKDDDDSAAATGRKTPARSGGTERYAPKVRAPQREGRPHAAKPRDEKPRGEKTRGAKPAGKKPRQAPRGGRPEDAKSRRFSRRHSPAGRGKTR